MSKGAVADSLAQAFPNVDVLVNDLGIFEPKPYQGVPDEDWRRFFEVNVLSGVRLARLYLPRMRRLDWVPLVVAWGAHGQGASWPRPC